jgi:hemerythrin-like domain-containing protein
MTEAMATSSHAGEPRPPLEPPTIPTYHPIEVLDASLGAVAGGTIGVLAGPIGVAVGAGIGALAGSLLGRQAAAERHEKDDSNAELDDVDAEEEFFHEPRSLGLGERASAPPLFSATAILTAEHRQIEPVLDAFDAWGVELESSIEDGRAETGRFVEVLGSFVNDWHHHREEGILFQMLDQACPLHERGPVASTLAEHGLLRGHLAALAALVQSPEPWTQAQRLEAIEAAASYTTLLRRDIATEESVLFPMADELLGIDANRELRSRFEVTAPPAGMTFDHLHRLSSSLLFLHPPHSPGS